MFDELLIVHHTHTDIGFTHPQPIFWELQRRFIDEAIDLCEQTADRAEPDRVRWTCEVTWTLLHWLNNSSSKQVDRFKKLARAGLISAGAMPFNITALLDRDELEEGFQPLKMLREELGLPLTVAMQNDVNGVPWSVIPLLKKFGVRMFWMGINTYFGRFPLTRPLFFRWQGPGEESVLAFNGEQYAVFDYFMNLAESDYNIDLLAAGMKEYQTRLAAASYPHKWAAITATYPVQADNNPPNPRTADLIRTWNAEGRTPRIRYATPEMILARVEKDLFQSVPTHRGDWTDYWTCGCASTTMETAIARRSRSLARTATKIATQSSDGADADRVRKWADEARRQILLFNEHTWGSWVASPGDRIEVVDEQWIHKAENAYMGRSLSELAVRAAFESWVGPIGHRSSLGSIVVVNPTDQPRREFIDVPRELIQGLPTVPMMSATAFKIGTRIDASAEKDLIRVGPIELGPGAWKVLQEKELKAAAAAAGCKIGEGFIRSPHLQLDFVPVSGEISQLRSVKSGKSLLAEKSRWSFFGFARETLDLPVEKMIPPTLGRDQFFSQDWYRLHRNQSTWKPDWPARYEGPTKLLKSETRLLPEGVQLRQQWSAPGVETMEHRITLLEDRASVLLEMNVLKQDVRTPESIYFVFPLSLKKDWRAWFDTAGTPTEVGREQLPGCCMDWLTVDNWICMADDEQAFALFCPDAPMVQVGDFSFGRMRTEVPRNANPLLLAWPITNNWDVNFRTSQPGWINARWEFHVLPRYDAEHLQNLSSHNSPLIWHPCGHEIAASGTLARS